MKLSDELEAHIFPKERIMPAIRQLEADSELLNGLIEMLCEEIVLECKDGRFSHWLTEIKGGDFRGSTPREAVEMAVRKYMESNIK